MITLVFLLCIVVVRYWWCSWFCEYLLLAGVAYVYMCGFLVDKVRLCFGFVY